MASEKQFAILALVGIVVLGFLVMNLDKFFPSPEVDLNENLPTLVNIDFDLSTGTNPRAPVALVEFSDFQCPFCQQNYEDVAQIRSLYGDKMNFVYKHFPLAEIHPQAFKAAEAMECARDQGKAMMYHDRLFAQPDRLYVADLKQHAVELGLHAEPFNNCLDSGEKADLAKRDLNDGIRLGVEGTPSFIVGGRLLTGVQAASTFKALLDAELEDE